MNRLTCSVGDVVLWGPCSEYTERRIEELFAGRETLSAEEIFELDIPAKDKLWTVLREEMLPADMLHEFACWVAAIESHREREKGREPDPRSWKAVSTKWAWLKGEATDEELAAGAAAAGAVAGVAAEAAAWAAADAAPAAAYAASAAAYAASAAAWAAVWAAADAARTAAYAARAAAGAEQISLLKELCKNRISFTKCQ